MSEWKSGTFAEIADIEMGQSPKGEDCSSEIIGLPLLNGPTEFTNLSPTPVQYTSDSRKHSRKGDILFCVRGSTTGKMNWSDQIYSIGRGIAAIRHKNGVQLNRFVRGIIEYNLDELLSGATGSTFPNVSRKDLESIKVEIPPLPEQKAIAEVLSSLDDKIDLLHRNNKTLEEMAETMFRKWFIEDANPTEILGNVIKTTSGGTPSRLIASYYEGEIPWVKSKELNNGFILDTEEHITANALRNSSAKLFKPYTVMIAMYGATIGEVGIICKESTCNQAICAIEPTAKYPYTFTYQYFKSIKSDLINLAVGGAQQNISQELIKGLVVIAPTDKIIHYHQNVEPFYHKILNNVTQIQLLEKMRDNLLPKLMSGAVRVNKLSPE
jgi:type I restriction enzyme S subunit